MASMKAIMLEISEAELERRHRLGLDRFDEMWEGVLHLVPAPGTEHQRMKSKLWKFLDTLMEKTGRGQVAEELNVFMEGTNGQNYRIPDIVYLAKGHEGRLSTDGVHGGPDSVIEVRSPGDETYEKRHFYANLGVCELVVIHRDTKAPEVFRLAGAEFVGVAADREGWVTAETLRVRFRRLASDPVRLAVEDLDDSSQRAEI